MAEEILKLKVELEKERKKLEKDRADFEEKNKQLVKQRQQFLTEQQQQRQQFSQAQTGLQNPADTSIQREWVQPIVTGRIGDLKEYSLREDWNLWVERLEQFFIANDITSAKGVSLFLTLLGGEAYALLRSLCTPALPASLPLAELIRIMKEHLQPRPSVIAERYKFKEKRQKDAESIKEYLADLKKLSTYCEFGNVLESNLRDQFVWGLRDDKIKKRLLGERDLSYARAVEVAHSMEVAMKDVAEMGATQKSQVDVVNYFGRKKVQTTNNRIKVRCYCCGKANHSSSVCKYRSYKCNVCHKEGHLAQVCKVKKLSKKNESKVVKNRGESNRQNFISDDSIVEDFDNLFNLRDNDVVTVDRTEGIYSIAPYTMNLRMQGMDLVFQIDTGSDVSVISEFEYRKSKELMLLTLRKSERFFKTHPGHSIKPLGFLEVEVEYKKKSFKLHLFVLPGKGPLLIGRTWLCELKIQLSQVLADSRESCIGMLENRNHRDIDSIVKEFESVFSSKLGKYTKGQFKLHLKENVRPIFCKPRPLPYAMKDKVEKELKRLVNVGVLEPVENSDWATPIVPVLKNNGEIRICGDYKITVNPCLKIDRYPVPRVQDLLASLNGGKVFSKIDLSQAYQQVELEEQSRPLVTISTDKGLFTYKRLCFGIASAPGLFQREMEKILNGLDGVVCFFDDIMISGPTITIHNDRLKIVLSRLKDCGLTANQEKCVLGKDSIEFLGYVLDGTGVHPATEKVKAIVDAPAPTDITQLRAFLGLLNYYSKFIRNFTEIVHPLYELLQKNVNWQWNSSHDIAFRKAKRCLISSDILVHYDAKLPIKVSCDASPFGLGSVLSQVYSDKSERPIAFASRALTKAEKNYSQLDREALSLIFGIKKFHQYLYGRNFILETDHKPLIYIFGSKKGFPQMAACRVQRWAVFLAAYQFEIKYIKGSDNCRADSLSRIPLPISKNKDLKEIVEISYLNYIKEGVKSLDSERIKIETTNDSILKKVREFVLNGWPKEVNDELKVFKNRERELTVEEGCILWGYRVVIPQNVRKELLDELHSIHMGVVKMKATARAYIWWPNIDKDIENVTKNCVVCLKLADNPPKSVLNSWNWPDGPNYRLHADFLGPIEGRMYLVIIDAFSKWLDVKVMPDITAESTVKAFKEYLSLWGIPYKLVTDNGPSFCSSVFSDFLKNMGIQHIRTAPYHPASNGLAENAVKTFKKKFKLLREAGSSSHEALYKFLFCYRATIHCTTNCSPAELQIGRKFRTKLNLIRPELRKIVEDKQSDQQRYFRGNRVLKCDIDDVVMAKDYSNNKWRKTLVTERLTPVTYNVKTEDNKLWKRHADQLRQCNLAFKQNISEDDVMRNVITNVPVKENCKTDGMKNAMISSDSESANKDSTNVLPGVDQDGAMPDKKVQIVRRSTRVPKPRNILDL